MVDVITVPDRAHRRLTRLTGPMLPVAELHLHVEGTLESELLITLARRNEVALPSYDPAVLTARNDFANLQSFLDVYYANLAVLRTDADFYDLATAYLTRAAAAGVRRSRCSSIRRPTCRTRCPSRRSSTASARRSRTRAGTPVSPPT